MLEGGQASKKKKTRGAPDGDGPDESPFARSAPRRGVGSSFEFGRWSLLVGLTAAPSTGKRGSVRGSSYRPLRVLPLSEGYKRGAAAAVVAAAGGSGRAALSSGAVDLWSQLPFYLCTNLADADRKEKEREGKKERRKRRRRRRSRRFLA